MPVLDTHRLPSPIHPFRIQQVWDGRTHTTMVDVRARRCPDRADGDQAQVEVSLRRLRRGGRRETYIGTSLILTPADARALALALCPELAPPA